MLTPPEAGVTATAADADATTVSVALGVMFGVDAVSVIVPDVPDAPVV